MTENNNIIFCKEEALSNAEIDRATFRLLAAFYNYNPDRNFIEALMNLTSGSVPMNGISSAVSMITKYACEAVRSDELVTELKRDWTKLFRGVAPDYGPKAPYEQLYVNSGSLKLISVLAQEYQCNGFAEYMEINNRHDYIGTELAYAAHLASLRLTAIETGNFEEYSKYQNMSDSFIENHPANWVGMFCEEAEKHAATDFYRGVLKLTFLTVTAKGGSDEFLF